jgi:hypothetical protein
MSTGAIVILIIAVVVVLGLVGWLVSTMLRRRQLQQRFGPEYDRALADGKDRRAAERDLVERQKRHAKYDITPLSAAAKERYARQWSLIQEEFVDHPARAVTEADRLVTVVMGERGYPTEGYEQQLADLSVKHAATLEHYRAAHEVQTRHADSQVSTEELREAMVHYRSMFEDLLGSDRSTVDNKLNPTMNTNVNTNVDGRSDTRVDRTTDGEIASNTTTTNGNGRVEPVHHGEHRA